MTAPKNTVLGKELGVSHATVSRWKSGDRLPELENMAAIAEVLGWSLDAQWAARQKGNYADEFSSRVAARDSVDPVVQEASTD